MPNSHRKPSRHPRAWVRPVAIAAVLALFVALLMMPYLHGHWRLADDAYEGALPFWRYQQRVLELGQWPHWNLNEGFGKPTAVAAGSAYFYPPVPIWGLLVGWTEQSYLYFVLLHLMAGACLAYRFCRRLGQSTEAALFSSFAYVGSGYVLGYFSNTTLQVPYLFWPLLGEGLWDLHENRDKNHGVTKIALSLALIESVGYPLTKLLIYLSTALAAFPLVKRHWRELTAATAIAILCTAPEWASALHALPVSARMGSDIYHDVSYGSPTNFLALGTLLIPTAFLRRDGFQLGMVWLERSWWVGILTLAILWAAYRRGAIELSRYRRFAWIALGGMLFAFGGHSFARELASVVLPIFESIRFANVGRMIPMALLAFWGGVGLDALQKQRPPASGTDSKARSRVAVLWAAFLVLCATAAVSQSDSGILSDALYFDPSTEWWMGALHTGFYLLLGYSAYKLRWRLSSRLGWAYTLVLIQFISMADVGYAFRHLIAKETQAPRPAQAETFVPASPQPNQRSTRQWLDGDDWIHWDGNVKVLNAYTIPYHRWMRAVASDPRTSRFASSLVSCHDNGAEIGLPPDPPGLRSCVGTQFTIDRYYGNTIEITGSSERPAWIMVHDFVDPGWKAELNGEETPIFAAFGVFKAVSLPAGHGWHLRFDYHDPWFPTLGWISALGVALLIGVAKFARAREWLRN